MHKTKNPDKNQPYSIILLTAKVASEHKLEGLEVSAGLHRQAFGKYSVAR